MKDLGEYPTTYDSKILVNPPTSAKFDVTTFETVKGGKRRKSMRRSRKTRRHRKTKRHNKK